VPAIREAQRTFEPPPETRRLGYRIGRVVGLLVAQLIHNPMRNRRARRSLAQTYAAQALVFGTADQALSFALDDLDGTPDQIQFLDDWQHGNLADWPQYQPAAPLPIKLGKPAFIVRAAAVFAGFFSALLLFSATTDAVLRVIEKDPVQILLELAWAAAVLTCALVAWRAAGARS
jgi:hypothetical protein